MRNLLIVVILVIVIVILFVFAFPREGNGPGERKLAEITPVADNMKIESSAFMPNESIPLQYTCDGANTNPPLSFSDVPEKTQSLVLIMEDPDVPVSIRPDGMWDHWVVFNIPPETREIGEGAEPKGIQGMTTFGKTGYGGPCPPDREHRYFFKLYALDAMLDLPEGATKEEVITAMEGHILSSAELVGKYNRQ